jgi:hypothetical protein
VTRKTFYNYDTSASSAPKSSCPTWGRGALVQVMLFAGIDSDKDDAIF